MKENMGKRLSRAENALSANFTDDGELSTLIQMDRKNFLRGAGQYRLRTTEQLIDAHLMQDCREIIARLRKTGQQGSLLSIQITKEEKRIELISQLPWPEIEWNDEDESWPFLAPPREISCGTGDFQ